MAMKKMNKKGQVLILGLMIAIFYFFFAVIAIPVIKEGITIARDATHLNCSSAVLTTGNQMTCLIVDLYLPYFIGIVIAVGISFMLVKGTSSAGG